jgi:hypothetical protein
VRPEDEVGHGDEAPDRNAGGGDALSGDALSRDARPTETPRHGDGPVPGSRHGSAPDGPVWPPSPSPRLGAAPEGPGNVSPDREAGPTDSPRGGPGEEPPAAAQLADDTSSGPTAVADRAGDRPADPASRGSITDTMAAELAGWAAGELPGQAAARLASWATAGGAVARGRQQARLGGGGTATERVS